MPDRAGRELGRVPGHAGAPLRLAWAVGALVLLAACAPVPESGYESADDSAFSSASASAPVRAPAPATDAPQAASATASRSETEARAAPEPSTVPAAHPGREAREPARASRHMISAANPLAAEAGRDILRAGGSAVDAVIAAQMVLNLVEPQSSGIGGGGFMLHYAAASGEIAAYDGRETAPAAAHPYMFLDGSGKPRGFFDAAVGGLSVGVPGLLRMIEMAHREHGRLPWARLFEPAISLAEEGFEVTPPPAWTVGRRQVPQDVRGAGRLLLRARRKRQGGWRQIGQPPARPHFAHDRRLRRRRLLFGPGRRFHR